MTFSLLILASDLVLWRSFQDMEKGSETPSNAYLGSDIVIPRNAFIELINSRLDCLGHTIIAEQSVFDTIMDSELRNCVISANEEISPLIERSLVTNCSFFLSGPFPAIYTANDVVFVGVSAELSAFYVEAGSGISFVGCATRLIATSEGGQISVFNDLRNVFIQNCLFDVKIIGRNVINATGLMLVSHNLTLLGSRMMVEINVFSEENRGNVSGCVGLSYDLLKVQNLDLIAELHPKYGYSSVSGFLISLKSGNKSLENSSICANIAIGPHKWTNSTQNEMDIGGLISSAGSVVATLNRISAFITISYNVTGPCSSDMVAGGFANTKSTDIVASYVYVMGNINVSGQREYSQHVAGLSISMEGNSRFQNCSYIGNITIENTEITSLYAAALFTDPDGGRANECEAKAQIKYSPLSASDVFLAGGVVKGSGKFSDLVLNVSIIMQVSSRIEKAFLACGGLEFASHASLLNSAMICSIFLNDSNNSLIESYLGIIIAKTQGDVLNCSGNGTIMISFPEQFNQTCYVGAIAATTHGYGKISDIFASAVLNVPNARVILGAAFGTAIKIPLTNIFVAAQIIGRENVPLSGNNTGTAEMTAIYLDCSLEGNDNSQANCVEDADWSGTAANLGKFFGYNESLNSGYPHLADLPAFQGDEFVLPLNGPFSEEFYYLDANGMPFPKTDYEICRGACYGVYSSPAVRECDGKGDLYCIDVGRAMEDFPGQSCISENAECNNGASVCSNEAELVLEGAEYSCIATCPNCANGRCQNAICECSPYHSGETCSDYSCDADSPTCFGDQTQECKPDNSGCQAADWCAALNCVHGKCADSLKSRCACDNLWAGVSCDNCYSFGPDCSIRQDECDALCGDHGVCRTPLTTICTCEDGLGGFNCQQCAEGHVFENNRCICEFEGKPCTRGHVCVDGKCVQACLVADENCISCHQIDPSLCSGCASNYRLVNGLCEFHRSKAIAPAIGATFGIVAAIAICLGVYLFFRIKRVQKTPASALSGVKPDIAGGKQIGKEEELIEDVQVVVPIENPE